MAKNPAPTQLSPPPPSQAAAASQRPDLKTPGGSTVADALEEAQLRVQELLQHPDDLNAKLKMLQLKFQAEKSSIDAIVKTSVQSQLDDTQDGLKMLWNANALVSGVKSNLGLVHDICLDTRSDIANYPRIKQIARTHLNFHNTMEIVTQFQELTKDIDRIAALLAADSQDLLGPAPNLLHIHHDLYRLLDFRDATIHRAKAQGPSVHQIVVRYFKKLDAVNDRFQEYLWQLARKMLQLIRENHGSVVVRLCKIVEAEERADELLLNNQNLRSTSASNGSLHHSAEWKVLAVDPRQLRNYRSQMFNAMLEMIQVSFMERLAPHEESVIDALGVCQFVFDDLIMVFDDLGPRFPPRYNVFDFFVLQYHKQVYDFLNRVSGSKLEARDILAITSWVRDYYRKMNERFSVSEELLEPRLLDDKEEELIQDYIRLIKSKLLEWVDRLLQTDTTEFQQRENPPHMESDGMYGSDSMVIFFQMINQQIDVAIDAARGGRLLLDVSSECLGIITYFQQKQTQMLVDEETKFLRGDPLPGGFPEYVIALCNNHMKGSEYVEVLQKRLESHLDEKYRADSSKVANETLDGFVKVAKRGYTCLLDIIFKDISPAFAQLFGVGWYNHEQIMSAIIQTLDDYLQDFRKHLTEYVFSKMTTDCLERFLVLYLVTIRSKQTKFKMSASFESIARSDLNAAIEFWSQFKTPKRVKQSFDLIEKIFALIQSSDSMLFLSWYSLWKTYKDVPITFVEEMLYKRDDLDKGVIKQEIANCKEKSKESNADAVESVFGKAFPDGK